MRRRRFWVTLTILSTFFLLPGSSAADDGAPLFPLRPGSRWVYSDTTGTIVAGEVVVIGPNKGGPGFEVLGYFSTFEPPRTLRSTGQDTVVQVMPDGTEHLYYMLDAPVGTSWVMDAPGATCIDGSKVTVGDRDLIVTVPAGTFEGVVRLDFASPCFDAGVTAEWFAPGIGLIRRSQTTFFGGFTVSLLSAEKVPGVE